MAESPGAMQLRTLQTIDGLGPTASNTVVLAIPIEILETVRAVGAAAGDGRTRMPELVAPPATSPLPAPGS